MDITCKEWLGTDRNYRHPSWQGYWQTKRSVDEKKEPHSDYPEQGFFVARTRVELVTSGL